MRRVYYESGVIIEARTGNQLRRILRKNRSSGWDEGRTFFRCPKNYAKIMEDFHNRPKRKA